MKVYGYEGGIRYEVGDLPEPSAAFMKFLDSIPCSCGGEAHDECKLRACDICGDVVEEWTVDGICLTCEDIRQDQNRQGTGLADEDEFIPELKKEEL